MDRKGNPELYKGSVVFLSAEGTSKAKEIVGVLDPVLNLQANYKDEDFTLILRATVDQSTVEGKKEPIVFEWPVRVETKLTAVDVSKIGADGVIDLQLGEKHLDSFTF